MTLHEWSKIKIGDKVVIHSDHIKGISVWSSFRDYKQGQVLTVEVRNLNIKLKGYTHEIPYQFLEMYTEHLPEELFTL